jgi:hypothetical protein
MTSDALTDRARLHRKANEALDQNLSPGESVEVIITGPSNQAMIGTDRRVFVYKKGFMAGASFGSELTSWDYQNLVGVQLHTGMVSGAVVLQAPGQSGVKTNVWKNSDSDPYKAPNAIPLNRPWEQAQVGVAQLRELIEAAQQGQHPPSPAGRSGPRPTSTSPSLADELKKLADLHAAGMLTAEEFASLKARLLRDS